MKKQYVKPQITSTYRAVDAINSRKVGIHNELNSSFMTNTPAYQSDE